MAMPARHLLPALFYIASALALAWFAGGQMAFGRIDAALAIPLLMPGALWLAWATRDEGARASVGISGAAVIGLLAAQSALHLALGKSPGTLQVVATLACGALCSGLAMVVIRHVRRWPAIWRGPVMLLAVLHWFAAGQLLIGKAYSPANRQPPPKLAILTGLPLGWVGDDLAAMLAAGPSDAPAVAELGKSFDVRLIDSLAELGDDELLLVAHPRALAPEELVRLDALTAGPRDIVILADALSTWPPSYPLGDPRNPPVTSLLTPLLDHWRITLAAPDPERAGDVELFTEPDGRKLLLHSAGRFTRLPAGCVAYGDRRVARCPIGRANVWLVGDADMLHPSLWQSPLPVAPWLRGSDNLSWLADRLEPAGRAAFDPIWIRP